jgi:hypothetical protein
MGQPRQTNDGGHTITSRPPLLAASFVILRGLIATLDAHCNAHRPNMAVHKRSDAAAAAAANSKTNAKVSKPKARTPKAAQETSQQSLRPRRTTSPKENDTNAHIATINLNRDRFVNVLSALGNASPSKRVTPPESPSGPEEELDNAAPQPNPDLEEPSHKSPQECHPAVMINEEFIVSPASECSTTASSNSTRGSALKNPSPAQATNNKFPRLSLDKFTLKGPEQGENYIINWSQKMYHHARQQQAGATISCRRLHRSIPGMADYRIVDCPHQKH